jgi:arabinofuranosyltransferase
MLSRKAAARDRIDSASMTRVRWVWLVLFAVVLLRTAWLGDDALITLRTVLNVTHGYGLTYNLHERVQTFTHPLWLGLITAAYFVVGNVFYAAFVVSIGTSLVVFGLVVRAVRTPTQLWIAAGVLLASRAFVDYSTSGLENPLTALVAVCTLAWATREVRGKRWLTCVWLGVSAAYLTRPDAVLLVLPVALWAALHVRPRQSAVLAVALGLLPAALWSAFSLVYYGFAFPNTAYAKLAADIYVSERIWQGLIYLLDSLNRDPVTLTAIGLSLIVATMERSKEAWLGAAGIVATLAYVVWIGGDFMSGRFLAAPVLVAVWLLARAQRLTSAEWWPVLGVVAAAAMASPLVPLRSDRAFETSVTHSGIVDERGVYFQTWSLLKGDRLAFAEPEWPRWDGRRNPEYVLDTCGLMGADGLSWGPRTYMLDECALADPLMARLPAIWKEEWRPGHYRRMVPEGYRESVQQDTNQLRDSRLAQYYTALRTVVRGPSLWSWDRLRTIWSLNVGQLDAHIDRQFYKFEGAATPLGSLSQVQPHGAPRDAPGARTFTTSLAVTCPDQPGRRVLDISLDSDDRYRVVFLKHNRIVSAVVVDVLPRDRRIPGLVSHMVTIPERARRQGFDTIVVFSVAGDERKTVGHLLLDGDPTTALELGRRFGAAGTRGPL